MFFLHLKLALRKLSRQKFFSILNILGLSIGICSCLLIFMYVQDEMSYDQFHEKSDRIYRLNQSNIWSESRELIAATGPPLAEALRIEFPEIESVVRINTAGDFIVKYIENGRVQKSFDESRLMAADTGFFQMFSFELLEGDPETALANPGSLVLTEETAERYFEEENALGKILLIGDDERPFQVTAVVANLPEQSHFQFDMMASMNLDPGVKEFAWSWVWTHMSTYVLLKEGASIQSLREKLPIIPPKYAQNTLELVFGVNYEEFVKEGNSWELALQPLADIHLYSGNIAGDRLGVQSDIQYIYIFSIIGLLILLIACINYMNLTTAHAAKRAKEVGVRKVLGSFRKQLIGQFLAEAIMISVFAMMLALLLTELILPVFNAFTSKALSLSILNSPALLGGLIMLTLFIGLFSGSYPSFYLTAFKPVEVLKGKIQTGSKSGWMRNGLVVFQFGISVILISCTLFVYQQLTYSRARQLGFQKENVVLIPHVERLGTQADAFKEAIKNHAATVNAGVSTSSPPFVYNQDLYKPWGSQEAVIPINSLVADDDYLHTLGFEKVDGRFFSKDHPNDINGVVLNEKAVRELGWENPVGEYLAYGSNETKFEVIGVMKDFHFQSLHNPIEPFALFHLKGESWRNPTRILSIRFQTEDLPAYLAMLKEKWAGFAPNLPFDYSFLDSDFQSQYQAERQQARLFSIFTGLAIFIACLGLLGLATFTAEQRAKEIGIRKVLGASVGHILGLLSKEYAKLIAIACLLAVPISWYAMQNWLENFSYHIDLNVQTFVLAGVLALITAAIAVSYTALKAAHTDPVTVLKDE